MCVKGVREIYNNRSQDTVVNLSVLRGWTGAQAGFVGTCMPHKLTVELFESSPRPSHSTRTAYVYVFVCMLRASGYFSCACYCFSCVVYRRVLESLFGDAARTSGPINAHKFNPAPRGTQLIIASRVKIKVLYSSKCSTRNVFFFVRGDIAWFMMPLIECTKIYLCKILNCI